MSEAPATLPVRERTPAAILAAQAVGVVDRLKSLDPARRLEVLQLAQALTLAEIQQAFRAQQKPPQDE